MQKLISGRTPNNKERPVIRPGLSITLTLLLKGCFLPLYQMAGADPVHPLSILKNNRKCTFLGLFLHCKV